MDTEYSFPIVHWPNLDSIKVINLPNLRIIDFGYGFTGSTHDSTAWEKTCIFQEHETIFMEDEFIWADSAYPVCVPSIPFHLRLTFIWLDSNLGCCTIQKA